MFRSDWDLVSASSWLTDFVDEEAFFSGRDFDLFEQPSTSTTMYILLPEGTLGRRSGRGRRGRQRQQPSQTTTTSEQETEKSQPAVAEGTQTERQTQATETDRERQLLMNEDFFADLPLGARAFETQMPTSLTPPKTKTKDGYSYLTYSYSSCATLDDKGETVESTRRRYEDSAGVMKAVHRRQMGDRELVSTWLKTSSADEGKHDKSVSSGTSHEFEQEWRTTPFGIAEKQALAHGEKKQTELPDAPPPQEIP